MKIVVDALNMAHHEFGATFHPQQFTDFLRATERQLLARPKVREVHFVIRRAASTDILRIASQVDNVHFVHRANSSDDTRAVDDVAVIILARHLKARIYSRDKYRDVVRMFTRVRPFIVESIVGPEQRYIKQVFVPSAFDPQTIGANIKHLDIDN